MQDPAANRDDIGSDLARVVLRDADVSVLVIGEPSDDLIELAQSITGRSAAVVSEPAEAGNRSFDVVWLLRPDPDGDVVLAAAELVGTSGRLVWRSINPASFSQMQSGRATAAGDRTDRLGSTLAALGLAAHDTFYPWPSASSAIVVMSADLVAHRDRLGAAAAMRESLQPLGWVESDTEIDALANILSAPSAADLLPERLHIAAVDPNEREAAGWAFSRIGLDVWATEHRFVIGSGSEDLPGETLLRSSVSLDPVGDRPQLGWLTFSGADNQPIPTSRSVLDDVLAALESDDIEQLGTVLKQWHSHLSALAVATGPQFEPTNPYATAEGEHIPGRYLDARFGNVALEPELRLLAPGWHASGLVSLSMVMTRSLWDFAHFMVTSGVRHPWSNVATVSDLTQNLAELGGMQIGPAHLDAWQTAEAALCTRLLGGTEADYGSWLAERSGSTSGDLPADLAPAALTSVAEDLREHVVELQSELAAAHERIGDLETELRSEHDAASTAADDAEWELANLRQERDRLADKIDAQTILTSEVLRKYERAVHERNMIEQGMNGYRQAVTVARRVMPTQLYFRVRKLVRGH